MYNCLQMDTVLQYVDQASLYDLGQAEQLLVHLALVPDHRLKLQASVLQVDIDRRATELLYAVDAIETVSRDVMCSHRLQQFMAVALKAVNFLNKVRTTSSRMLLLAACV